MTFAIADEEENSELFQQFGFDESSEEVNVGVIGQNERKYPMEPMDEFDSDEVETFLRSFIRGNISAECHVVLCSFICPILCAELTVVLLLTV